MTPSQSQPRRTNDHRFFSMKLVEGQTLAKAIPPKGLQPGKTQLGNPKSALAFETPDAAATLAATMAGLPGAPGGDDGTNSQARFLYPQGVAVDNAGNL